MKLAKFFFIALLLFNAKAAGAEASKPADHSPLSPVENSDNAKQTIGEPLLIAIHQSNQQLADELNELKSQISDLKKSEIVVTEEIARVKNLHEHAKDKVSQMGLTGALGLKLRNDHSQLPEEQYYNAQLGRHRHETKQAQLRRMELEDRLIQLADVNSVAQRLIALEEISISEKSRRELVHKLESALIEQRSQYVSDLIDVYDTYFNEALIPLMEKEQVLVDEIRNYKKFIDSRILWIQSTWPLRLDHFRQIPSATQWLLNLNTIKNILLQFFSEVLRNPLPILLPVIGIIILSALRGKIKRRLDFFNNLESLSQSKILYNLAVSLLLIFFLSIPLPLATFTIAWVLRQIDLSALQAPAVSDGLFAVTWIILFGKLTQYLCKQNGLGHSQFRWNKEILSVVQVNLRWFIPAAIGLTFVVVSTQNQPFRIYQESLGRISFTILMLFTSFLMYRLTKPNTGIFKEQLKEHPSSWLARLSGIWFPLVVVFPILLATTAAMGYQYTAYRVGTHTTYSLYIILAAVIARSFLLRAVEVAYTKFFAADSEKNAEDSTDARNPDQTSLDHKSQQAHSVESTLDIHSETANIQSTKLVNSIFWLSIAVGLIYIWAEIIPAFSLLNDIELWQTGAPAPGENDSESTHVPITLANAISASAILVVTILVSKNIPGFLEISLLQRLPISGSGRYAIATIVRYGLVIVGLAMTFSAIGIGWSKVQWLAAAITVGLGFGLQEIFANFVSGLIILFERQVRVGDIVTVGNISGKVNAIQMRATTITDWDRKELIIPNKEFVTGQVINWSLSDTILRLVIPVGIAYGSDTELAYNKLLAVARSHRHVLDDPEPNVRFLLFGESSLDFELRVFIPHIDFLIETKHELHMQIDQAFRDAEIEIAFPQRDIHIRDIAPFDPSLLMATNKSEKD